MKAPQKMPRLGKLTDEEARVMQAKLLQHFENKALADEEVRVMQAKLRQHFENKALAAMAESNAAAMPIPQLYDGFEINNAAQLDVIATLTAQQAKILQHFENKAPATAPKP